MRGNRSLPQPREDRTMRHVLRLTVLLLFGLGLQLLGCSDAPSPMTAPDSEETAGPGTTLAPEPLAPEPVAIEPTSAEETFARLRNLFPQPILDEGFTTLREVTNSQPYLDFLAQEFPTDVPFRTYEVYLQVAPLDAARYRPFLEKWIGVPMEEDIAAVHRMTVKFREANMMLFREDFGHKELVAIFERHLQILNENAFLKRHQLDVSEKFIKAFVLFVVETEKADARWLKEQFEEHGEENGLLWSALGRPALIGEILHNFAEPAAFLTWVEETGSHL